MPSQNSTFDESPQGEQLHDVANADAKRLPNATTHIFFTFGCHDRIPEIQYRYLYFNHMNLAQKSNFLIMVRESSSEPTSCNAKLLLPYLKTCCLHCVEWRAATISSESMLPHPTAHCHRCDSLAGTLPPLRLIGWHTATIATHWLARGHRRTSGRDRDHPCRRLPLSFFATSQRCTHSLKSKRVSMLGYVLIPPRHATSPPPSPPSYPPPPPLPEQSAWPIAILSWPPFVPPPSDHRHLTLSGSCRQGEDGEVILRTHGDCWVVGRKSDEVGVPVLLVVGCPFPSMSTCAAADAPRVPC